MLLPRARIPCAFGVAALAVSLTTGGVHQVESPSPVQLQAECLRYREDSTRHAFLLLHIVDDNRGVGPSAGTTEIEHRIWCSGARLRFDTRRLQTGGKWGGWEHYVVDDDRYIWIPELEYKGVIASTQEFGSSDDAISHFHLYHPRWLGMGQNSEGSMQVNPKARFVNPGITTADFEVTTDSMGGFQTLRVVRKTSFPPAEPDAPRTPGEFVMWFAPEAGNSLVRAELREFLETGTMIRSVESRLEQFAHDGVWFPREIIRETTYGDRVTRRQVITIQEAEFGRPPDDAVFTVQGMELAEGKHISDRTVGPRPTELISDGTKVVEIRGPAVQPAVIPDAAGNRLWLLVLNAILLAILAAFFFMRMLKSRRTGSSDRSS